MKTHESDTQTDVVPAGEAAEFSTVQQLAKRLEMDIRVKSLAPGDRYLTASEAAQMLGVSRTVAHRALLVLAKQDLVVRRRGQGTLIGPAMQASSASGSQSPKKRWQSVFLLEPSSFARGGEVRAESLLPLLRERFDQAVVHMISLPEHDAADYVSQSLERARLVGECLGVIALSCTRPVYSYLADTGIPCVVIGSLYPDQRQSLPSIDINLYQVGELLVQCLAARGHRRLGLLMGAAGRAGTEFLLNGVLTGMHDAGLSPADLTARFHPGNEEGFEAQVKDLLSMPERPTAILAASRTMAECILTIAARMGLSVPDEVDLSYLSERGTAIGRLSCPRVQPERTVDTILLEAVDMLWRQSQGLPLKERTVQIPVMVQTVGGTVSERR